MQAPDSKIQSLRSNEVNEYLACSQAVVVYRQGVRGTSQAVAVMQAEAALRLCLSCRQGVRGTSSAAAQQAEPADVLGHAAGPRRQAQANGLRGGL